MELMIPALKGAREALKERMLVKCLAQCPPRGSAGQDWSGFWLGLERMNPSLRGERLPRPLSPVHARTWP